MKLRIVLVVTLLASLLAFAPVCSAQPIKWSVPMHHYPNPWSPTPPPPPSYYHPYGYAYAQPAYYGHGYGGYYGGQYNWYNGRQYGGNTNYHYRYYR